MKNYLNAIRIIALICIAGKAVSVSLGATDGETNLSTSFHTLLITFLLLSLLYFAIEFSTRFFIWPQVKSIHAIASFKKNVKDAVANTVEPEQEPIKEVSPLDTPKAKEVIAYTLGTFAGVLTNEELMALESNLKAFILGKRDLEPAVNRRITNLTTMDICHFGWNITKRLKICNDDMAIFLKSQFVWHLDDCTLKTISKKLSVDSGKFYITRINPKEVLLPFPLAKKLRIS